MKAEFNWIFLESYPNWKIANQATSHLGDSAEVTGLEAWDMGEHFLKLCKEITNLLGPSIGYSLNK